MVTKMKQIRPKFSLRLQHGNPMLCLMRNPLQLTRMSEKSSRIQSLQNWLPRDHRLLLITQMILLWSNSCSLPNLRMTLVSKLLVFSFLWKLDRRLWSSRSFSIRRISTGWFFHLGSYSILLEYAWNLLLFSTCRGAYSRSDSKGCKGCGLYKQGPFRTAFQPGYLPEVRQILWFRGKLLMLYIHARLLDVGFLQQGLPMFGPFFSTTKQMLFILLTVPVESASTQSKVIK